MSYVNALIEYYYNICNHFLSANGEEKSGLTYDALRRHDVLQTNNLKKIPAESSMDSMSESGLTSISFASDWSSCSNKSFDKYVLKYKN